MRHFYGKKSRPQAKPKKKKSCKKTLVEKEKTAISTRTNEIFQYQYHFNGRSVEKLKGKRNTK